jgi:hypothetical protein
MNSSKIQKIENKMRDIQIPSALLNKYSMLSMCSAIPVVDEKLSDFII